ncbi:MAG: sulfatase-like hydrolase/transferase, partial [Mycobacterium sp.]|nr:sulfatase-like hydrolase/transferase [Mycobacterium sp.]
GKVGKQIIEDTGPLTRKRMETVDEEFITAAIEFMERNTRAQVPWFCYLNTTRMHVWTHLKPESEGKTGLGVYADGMVELDGYVGQLLDKLDELGVADNTIVVFTTDNGAEVMTWPDGGTTPFRGEKDTNWEGGWRIPCLMRWPGVIQPGRVVNDICSLQDFLPTFAAAAGEPDLVEKVKTGYLIGDKTFKVHIDGVNLLPFLSGEQHECPREGFVYWSDDGEFLALRVRRWKMVFAEQRSTGLAIWREPFSPLRLPKVFDLRTDPFERGDEGDFFYAKWFADHAFLVYPAQAIVAQWLASFKEFPPRAKAASFTIDKIMEQLTAKKD